MPEKINSLISTRDPDEKNVTLKEAIRTSQPSDGGLFTFSEFPELSDFEIAQMSDFSYQQLAKTLLGRFDFDLPEGKLDEVIDSAYGEQWESNDITPVQNMGNNHYLLELFHGPTQAFKDVALQFLPRILSEYRSEGEIMRALGASSGDTISASHYGVGGVDGLESIFLLPQDGPSEFQQLQTTAHGFNNVMTILTEGKFDDGQAVIKKILSGSNYTDFKKENNFVSFNSINIARIMAQIVYYFKAYLDLVKQGVVETGDYVNFSVPSGNFGDALAGVYAKKMGLPINKINIATNENNVLERMINEGIYEPAGDVITTRAPSQDIKVSSNWERMLFEIVGKDPERVAELMKQLKEKGKYQLTSNERNKIKRLFTATTTSDAEIDNTIADVYDTRKFAIDTHTATGVDGAVKAFGANPDIPTISLATADHIKFDMPEGVPVDTKKLERLTANLKKNDEVYLKSRADEQSLVTAIRDAVGILEEKRSNYSV
ncbi:threonine synthase [Candidatus Peregrinibacteria bacterium]|nr:threonine synthase [Candidatus Peregrinibacteria bacterium]